LGFSAVIGHTSLPAVEKRAFNKGFQITKGYTQVYKKL